MIRTDVLKRWREHRMEDEIKEELIDQPLDGYSGPEGLVGPEGLLAELKKRLMNRVLDAGLTAHLGRGKHAWANGGNVRSGKTLRSDDGKLAIEVPRDRKGELEPALAPKRQRRFDGFGEAVVSRRSRGLAVRDVQERLLGMHKVEVSPMLIPSAAEAAAEEVEQRQARPLERAYPIVHFDATVAKARSEGEVSNRAVCLALAIAMEGRREALGMRSSRSEGSKFWLNVLTELKGRGVSGILVCCLSGLSEAIETVYPKAAKRSCASRACSATASSASAGRRRGRLPRS